LLLSKHPYFKRVEKVRLEHVLKIFYKAKERPSESADSDQGMTPSKLMRGVNNVASLKQ
jgi:hypothetical protein